MKSTIKTEELFAIVAPDVLLAEVAFDYKIKGMDQYLEQVLGSQGDAV